MTKGNKKLLVGLLVFALTTLPSVSWAQTKQFQVDTGGTLTTNLTSYWPMEQNSNDFFGSNNGTDTDITYATSSGKVNYGADFNGGTGNTSQISVDDDATLDFTTALTVAVWVKNDDGNNTAARDEQIVTKYSTTADASWAMDYQRSNRSIRFYFGASDGTFGGSSSTAANAIDDTNWHLVLGTYNAGVTEIYIDNVATSTTGTGTIPSSLRNSAKPLMIGQRADGTGAEVWNGSIDEVGVWAKVLSAQERTDIYNAGAGQTMILVGGAPTMQIIRHR